MFKWSSLCLSLCPLPLVLSVGTTERSLAPSSLLLPTQVFVHTDEITPSLLFSRLSSPSIPSLSSYDRCSSPFIILVAFRWSHPSRSMSHLYWGAQCWTQQSRSVSPGLSRGEGSPPSTCW